MKKSPWAKLMMSSTPNSSASPAATSASDEPTTSPFSACSSTWLTITPSPAHSPSVQAWGRGSCRHLGEVGGGEGVRAGEFGRLVGAEQDAAVHRVQPVAQRLDQ